jgi:6-pyruvoyltetrahydropterin/6-carboxytetrahydropterin synthase
MNLRCIVEGEIDPQTGYLCNIKLLDTLLRDAVGESLTKNNSAEFTAESFLLSVAQRCRHLWKHSASILALELDVSSFLTWRIDMEESMISMTEQFEFSAAHRLHCDDLTDEQNHEIFGKCNHPGGHGHNYVIAVTLGRKDVGSDGQVMNLDEFESIVNQKVIDRLDHKNLNVDEPYFQKVNPTVENIAVAIYGWLEGQFGDATLLKVRVFETPKTWAEFPTC